jgi:hypothetical protein
MTWKEIQVVAGGHSAAGCLLRALGCGRSDMRVNRDQLSCGPLASLTSVEGWRQFRKDYWREIFPISDHWALAEGKSFPPHDILHHPEELLTADVVTVWLGSGLPDQLFLAWFIQLAELVGLDLQRIRVVQFRLHPATNEDVIEVGRLDPRAAAAHPSATKLTSASITDLREAWTAITSTEPASLLRFVEAHADQPTVFSRAFKRLLGRFPDYDTGLNRWDFELLKRVPEGGITKGALLAAVFDESTTELDAVGEIYLSHRLRKLASLKISQPLLSLEGPSESYSRCRVRLTTSGKDVLCHKANFVEMNGIDEWVGGIHLQSAAKRVWFHSKDSLVARAA